MEEVDRKLVDVDIGAIGIEQQSRAAEMIDERGEAAAAPHRPVEQEVVGGAEYPLVPEHLVPDLCESRVGHLAADQMDGSDRVAEGPLNAPVALVDRVGRLTQRFVDADRRVEIAQYALEVLGVVKQR
jgi:hypothetical protein